jgi:8-oxo-dGTP diphosphatase
MGIECPRCGREIEVGVGPRFTVDIIIEMRPGTIVLVRRRFPPPGWALPGGFVEEGESAEAAAIREAKEETNLDVRDLEQFHVYSEPGRDPRHHTISLVLVGRSSGTPRGGDDAAEATTFTASSLPGEIAFDHGRIIADYFAWREASGESV